MSYIDGFVTPVPNDNREAYRKHAAEAAALFRSTARPGHGVLGRRRSRRQAHVVHDGVKREANESCVSPDSWPSRAVRDGAWKQLMADPRMQPGAMAMPFDGKRMIYGGFDVLLDA